MERGNRLLVGGKGEGEGEMVGAMQLNRPG